MKSRILFYLLLLLFLSVAGYGADANAATFTEMLVLATISGTTASTGSSAPVDTTLSTASTTSDINAPSTSSLTSQSATAPSYQSAQYGYDEFDRLKWVQYEDGTVISYDYDKVGNRSAKTTYQNSVTMYTVTVTVSGNGTVVPSGTITAPSGSTLSFALQANPGSVVELFVDNVYVPSKVFYTLTNITANHTLTANFSGLPTQPCTNYPARLAGATPVNYLSLQAAYDSAVDGSTIQGNMYDHMEALRFDRGATVTLDGGYSCDYTSNTGNLPIRGAIEITNGGLNIMSGNVVLMEP
jgi:YD repeat-containing protein